LLGGGSYRRTQGDPPKTKGGKKQCLDVTGSRAAWLKHNGKIAEFATREEAEAEAAHYNKTAIGDHRAAPYGWLSAAGATKERPRPKATPEPFPPVADPI
jgi:hypothetical protein